MISHKQLERWKALADAATPGPWEYLDLAGYPEVYPAPASYDKETVFSDTPQGADNARFAAAAREAVPALIAEVEGLRAVLGKTLIVMHGYRDDHPEDFGVFENNALRNAEAALKEGT